MSNLNASKSSHEVASQVHTGAELQLTAMESPGPSTTVAGPLAKIADPDPFFEMLDIVPPDT